MKKKIIAYIIVFKIGFTGMLSAQNQPAKDIANLKAAEAVMATPFNEGPFKPVNDSLKKIPCPEWFRDAKFGIWSHWTPASVPGFDNGYPTDMYHQGSADYKYHLAHYGHPSEKGFRAVVENWKADKFNPQALMKKYVAAGAKYFFTISTHHDNFDNYASSYTRWNAVEMGPHRDIVGEWAKAAKANNIHFGISSHADRAWVYYKGSYGADTSGDKKGIPYDGTNSEYWSLYQKPHGPKDKPSPEFIALWYARHREMIDKYQPELLYFDGPLPFPKEAGLKLAAHFYNVNAAKHNGKPEAIINVKGNFGIRDYERGVADTITQNPWQDDTSLGGWFFLNTESTLKNDKMSHTKTTAIVIHTLADVISKNGNLLMNFPQYGDGSLYPECEQVLSDLAKWMPINEEAVFGTRPWKKFGEGPTIIKAAYMNEPQAPFTSKDIRFTTKGNTLYAFILGWPGDGETITINSLSKNSDNKVIKSVKLLGSKSKIVFSQNADGLKVTLPNQKPCDYAVVLKIE